MNAATKLPAALADFSLPGDGQTPVGPNPWAPLPEVLANWRAQIGAESLNDREVVLSTFRLLADNGALTRDPSGAQLLAYTPTAFRQLLSFAQPAATVEIEVDPTRRPGVLVQRNGQFFEVAPNPLGRHPNNLAGCLRYLPPSSRSVAFADLLARAGEASRTLLFRTAIDARTGVRTLRAVVSQRHSLSHGDDLVLIGALAEFSAGEGGRSWVRRGWDYTHGSIQLPCGADAEVSSGLSFRNSETCQCSLEIRAAAVLAIGAQVTVSQRSATYANARLNASRRGYRVRHVGGARVSREILGAVETAMLDGGRLADLWAKAKALVLTEAQAKGLAADMRAEGVDAAEVAKIECALTPGTLAHAIGQLALFATTRAGVDQRWDIEALAGSWFDLVA